MHYSKSTASILLGIAMQASASAIPASDIESPSKTLDKRTYPAPAWPTWTTCPKGQTPKTTEYDCNFDNQKSATSMAGNLMQVPVGYCGVKFNSFFDVTTLGVGAITGTGISVQPGIRPHSPAVYAGTDSMSRDMFGEAEITTNFPLSNSIATNMKSFYMGCSLQTEQGAAGIPSGCKIVLTGYRNSDNTVSFEDQVCSKTFEFRPTTLTGLADMAYSGDISGLCPGGVSFYTFTIGALDEDSETPLEVLLIDNVELDTVSCI